MKPKKGDLLIPKLPFGARSKLIGIGLGVVFICIAFMPWISFTTGQGQVTAIDPNERVQSLTASVNGFIGEWYVKEGDFLKAGTVLVDLVDTDPGLLERLKKQRDAAKSAVDSAELMTTTAQIDLDRQKSLFEQGLASRKDFELARIKFTQHQQDRSKVFAEYTKTQTELSRQSSQRIVAPRDGTITRILPGERNQLIKSGTPIAIFSPRVTKPAVEVWIDGNDSAYLQPGQTAQIQFEGWPTLQVPGWPALAINTFQGKVYLVDQASSMNGKFRVLITPDSKWPSQRLLRLGMHAKSYIKIRNSFILKEVWRVLNGFPPLQEPIYQELKRILDPKSVYDGAAVK